MEDFSSLLIFHELQSCIFTIENSKLNINYFVGSSVDVVPSTGSRKSKSNTPHTFRILCLISLKIPEIATIS